MGFSYKTWAESWGSSWGFSWGEGGDAPAEDTRIGSWVPGGHVRRKKKKYKQPEFDDLRPYIAESYAELTEFVPQAAAAAEVAEQLPPPAPPTIERVVEEVRAIPAVQAMYIPDVELQARVGMYIEEMIERHRREEDEAAAMVLLATM